MTRFGAILAWLGPAVLLVGAAVLGVLMLRYGCGQRSLAADVPDAGPAIDFCAEGKLLMTVEEWRALCDSRIHTVEEAQR